MTSDSTDTTTAFFETLAEQTRSSMFEDIEHGRRLKVEFISGRMHSLGLAHGIPTPCLHNCVSSMQPGDRLEQGALGSNAARSAYADSSPGGRCCRQTRRKVSVKPQIGKPVASIWLTNSSLLLDWGL